MSKFMLLIAAHKQTGRAPNVVWVSMQHYSIYVLGRHWPIRPSGPPFTLLYTMLGPAQEPAARGLGLRNWSGRAAQGLGSKPPPARCSGESEAVTRRTYETS